MQEKADELFQSGKTALQNGKVEEALKFLSMSLSYQSRPEAYIFKAQAEIARKDIDKALDEINNGLRACARESDSTSGIFNTLTTMQAELEAKIEEKKAKKKKLHEDLSQFKAAAITCKSYKDFATKHEQPSARLLFIDEEKPGAVVSKLAGIPDVPENFKWPKNREKKPIHFLCQILLKDLQHDQAISKELPKSGMLSFFYDVDEMPWGFSDENDSWYVYHFEDTNKLAPAKDPVASYINSKMISFESEPSYPDQLADEFNGAIDTEGEEDDDYYSEFLEAAYGDEPYHRLLGHPQLVQGDLREECESASIGKSPKSVSGQKKLFTDSRAWRLLLQLDSDNDCNMMWGDGGYIYFCIKDNDLKSGDFSKVWLQLQCT